MVSSRCVAPTAPTFSSESSNSSQEQRFWAHFVNSTCRVMTLPFEGSTDPIMSRIISRGMGDTMIANSILCLGASHLINSSIPSSSEVQSFAIHKGILWRRAREELTSRVDSLRPDLVMTSEVRIEYEALLTAYVLLYLYEMSEGTCDRSWQKILNEARSFVHDIVNNQDVEDLSIDKSLMQFFLYHDVLARVLDIDENHGKRQSPDPISLEALYAGFFDQEPTIGMHYGLVEKMWHIHKLESEIAVDTVPKDELIVRAVHIWQKVNEWTAPGSASDLCHLYEAYIAAISIWTFSIIHPIDPASRKVEAMVLRGILSLSAVDDSILRTASLFPFYVIGMRCFRGSDREDFMKELDRLDSARQMGHIRKFRMIIQQRWEEYDGNGSEPKIWNCMTQETGLSLPLS